MDGVTGGDSAHTLAHIIARALAHASRCDVVSLSNRASGHMDELWFLELLSIGQLRFRLN